MEIKEIKIEKIALFLLTTFILILFVDYCFDITTIINQNTTANFSSLKRTRLVSIIFISILPIINFIDLTEFRRNNFNSPTFIFSENIIITSFTPFMSFLFGFYMLKINYLFNLNGFVVITILQFILQLTIFSTVSYWISKAIKCYSNITSGKPIQPISDEKLEIFSILYKNKEENKKLIDYLNTNLK